MTKTLQERVAEIPYWYHRVALPGGITTPGWAPLAPDAYGIPDDMKSERILDIGCWDGYWAIEALKRRASHVIALDNFSDTCGELINAKRTAWDALDLCLEAFTEYGYQDCVSKINGDVERITFPERMIDRIFCFGVLYHLKNPVLALQNCFNALKPGGWIHVETAILDNMTSGYTGKPCDPSGCYAEFYPTNEFGVNNSNWWVPTLKCASAWLKGVGFEDIEAWKLTETPQSLAECRGFLRARKA